MRTLLTALLSSLLTLGLAAAEGWLTDFEAAKAAAAKDGKDLLVDFTGSDWCGWCIKLKDEVFQQPGFIPAASKHFVLVEIDFPQRTELPATLKGQNDALQQTYGIQGFPTILLLDAQGRAFAKTGYQAGGPQPYLQHLQTLRLQKQQRDEAFAKAAAVSGAEQAQLYHAALQGLGADVPLAGYEVEVAAIIAGDADGSLGLKLGYEVKPQLTAVMASIQSGDLAAARRQIDALLATPGLAGELKQEVLFRSALVQFNTDQADKAAVAQILKDALAAAPEGALAGQIQQILQQFAP